MLDNEDEARSLIGDLLWKALTDERQRLERIDSWLRWDHDQPHAPQTSTKEYKQLAARAQTPWLALVVTAVAQALYVEGFRTADAEEEAGGWLAWQANGFDGRQVAIHRAALAYGLSYVTVLPGTLHGQPMPTMRGVSPRRMIAVYEDPAEDDWPLYALQIRTRKGGWRLRLLDDTKSYLFTSDAYGGELNPAGIETHDAGVCPAVRYANMLDLEGRADGEVEPLIPVAGRIDQTTFDRLVVQRYSSWVVRTVAGMVPPDSVPEENIELSAEQRQKLEEAKMRLKVEDILVADDKDTKFGSLPATPLTGFIEAKDADIRDLAAVSQTPPHHLLGQMANLSAEALAAAEASLNRKVEERKHGFGESHEQSLRLASQLLPGSEVDLAAQVRWKDMESRSLAQVADALGKLATMLGVPPEMLWEKIPGWTQQDIDRAKELAKEGGGMADLLRELAGGQVPPAA